MTILGQPSLAELEDLVAAKDFALKRLSDAFAHAGISVVTRGDPSWSSDFARMQVRYGDARAKAESSINASKYNLLTPKNLLPAAVQYNRVLRAVQQEDGKVTKGDLQDLSNRLSKLGFAPDYSGMPSARAESDFEKKTMDLLGAALKPGKDLLDKLEHMGEGGKPPVSFNWGKAILLAVVGGIAGVVGLRWAAKKTAPYVLPVASVAVRSNPYALAALTAAQAVKGNEEAKRHIQEAIAAGAGVKIPEELK